MAFSVSPSTVAPGGSLTATGTGSKKRQARIRVASTDTTSPNSLLASFVMPANGRFTKTFPAPDGPARETALVLQQLRADGVWAQTASVTIRLLMANGEGGGTTPVPNDPPPPTPDITAPVISNVVIDQITTTSFRVSWTTNEASDTRLDYGIDATYGSQSALVGTLVTSHQVTVSGLTSGITYHVRARSRDATGNLALSSDRVVSTLPTSIPPGPEPPGSTVDVSNTAEFEDQIGNTNLSEIVLNPGTYQPDSDIAPDYFLPPTRTADNPLLIRALNVPSVATDPFDVIWKSRIYLRNRRGSYVTWRGLSFEDISVGTTGIVTFGAYGEPGPDHFAFETIRFVDNIPLNGSNSHHSYLSSGSSSYGTIDDFFVEGVDRNGFTGFHAYHLDLGHHITVKNGVIRKVYAGLLMYGTAGASPPTLTNFLAEDIDIQDAGTGVDIRYVQGVLRRVAQANVGPGTSYIKGPITLDDCPTLPSPVP